MEFASSFSWPAKDMVAKFNDLDLYFTTNLLLGMLVDADIRAVIGMEANEKRVEVPDDTVDRFLEKFPNTSPLNSLRREFYTLVIENIRRADSQKIFSLTAPTGIGKTLAGFSAALKLRNQIYQKTGRQPRIIYVLPFTSIIDQNYEVIKNVIENSGISNSILLKHHFRSSPTIDGSKLDISDVWKSLEETKLFEQKDVIKIYEQAHTKTETWDGEIIVTTFVRFY